MAVFITRTSIAEAPPPSGDVLFSFDPSDPNANGSNLYNFDSRYGTTELANGQTLETTDGLPNGSYTHMPTGGRFGGPCTRVTFFAGRWQYNLGYHIPAFSETWGAGDSRFLRGYIRIDDSMRFDNDNAIKLWDDRGQDNGGSTRSILYLSPPYDITSGGGKLGSGTNVEAPGYPDSGGNNVRDDPPWFGLSGGSGAWVSTYSGLYGSLSFGNGVGLQYTDPGIVSYGNNSSCPANANSTSQAACGGWIEFQIEQKQSTTTNDQTYKLWINNNDYANPSAVCRTFNSPPEPQGVANNGWNNLSYFPAYCDGGSGTFNTADWYIDIEGLEVARSFDSSWFRGAD